MEQIYTERSFSESDTEKIKDSDTSVIFKFNPRKATIRSALIPGWGQAYNKKYWKIPIVYAALGVSAGFFFSNINTYNELRQAVVYRSDDDLSNNDKIPLSLRPWPTQALIRERNIFRQYIDYSVLTFIFFWGLNVVDATVDAHLKGFDVSPEFSLKIKPKLMYSGNAASVGLVFRLEKRKIQYSLAH